MKREERKQGVGCEASRSSTERATTRPWTKKRLPEMAGWAQVALSATAFMARASS
jgi:hypothetical protein